MNSEAEESGQLELGQEELVGQVGKLANQSKPASARATAEEAAAAAAKAMNRGGGSPR